jgi:hypothetical protein
MKVRQDGCKPVRRKAILPEFNPLAKSAGLTLPSYLGNMVTMKQTPLREVARVQVGARMEKTLVKVLKALAEYLDLSLGDLLEGVTLHALEGKSAFSPQTLAHIKKLRTIYGLNLSARDSHRLTEKDAKRARR